MMRFKQKQFLLVPFLFGFPVFPTIKHNAASQYANQNKQLKTNYFTSKKSFRYAWGLG
jgi:hypothetical protein